MITQDEIKEHFGYRDGVLFWKKTGNPAGSKTAAGYLRMTFQKKSYYVHRAIYLLHHGVLPESIDHINGNKADNRIENLRGCSLGENNRNVGARKKNALGVKNVHWCKKDKKYKVQIKINKVNKYIGSYADLELAELVAAEARNNLHGAFAHHGG